MPMPLLLANIANIHPVRKHLPDSYLCLESSPTTPACLPDLMPPKSVGIFSPDTLDEDDDDDLPPLVEAPPFTDDNNALPRLPSAPLSLTLSPALHEHGSESNENTFPEAGAGTGMQYTFATTMTPSAFDGSRERGNSASPQPDASSPLYPPGLPRPAETRIPSFHASPSHAFQTHPTTGTGQGQGLEPPSPSNADAGSSSPAPSPSFGGGDSSMTEVSLSLDEQREPLSGPFRFGAQGFPQGQTGGGGRKSARPPSYIPRPPNAFILFRASFVRNQRLDAAAASSSTSSFSSSSALMGGGNGVSTGGVSALGPGSVITIEPSSSPSPSGKHGGKGTGKLGLGSGISPNSLPTTTPTPSTSLSKLAGQLWRALPANERAVWESRARAAQAEHRAKYPDWRFRPENASGVGFGTGGSAGVLWAGGGDGGGGGGGGGDDWGGGGTHTAGKYRGGGTGTGEGSKRKGREKDKDKDKDKDKEREKGKERAGVGTDPAAANSSTSASASASRASSSNSSSRTRTRTRGKRNTGAGAKTSGNELGLPSWAIEGLGFGADGDHAREGADAGVGAAPCPKLNELKREHEPEDEDKNSIREGGQVQEQEHEDKRGREHRTQKDTAEGDSADKQEHKASTSAETVDEAPKESKNESERKQNETRDREDIQGQDMERDASFVVVPLTSIARRSASVSTRAGADADTETEGTIPVSASIQEAGSASSPAVVPTASTSSATRNDTESNRNLISEGEPSVLGTHSREGQDLVREFDLGGEFFEGTVSQESYRDSPHSRASSVSHSHSRSQSSSAQTFSQSQLSVQPQTRAQPREPSFTTTASQIQSPDLGSVSQSLSRTFSQAPLLAQSQSQAQAAIPGRARAPGTTTPQIQRTSADQFQARHIRGGSLNSASGVVRTLRRNTVSLAALPSGGTSPISRSFRTATGTGFSGGGGAAYGYGHMFGYERVLDAEQASPPPLSPSLSSPLSVSSPTAYGQSSPPFALFSGQNQQLVSSPPLSAHLSHPHPHPYANARTQQFHMQQQQQQMELSQRQLQAQNALSPMMLSAHDNQQSEALFSPLLPRSYAHSPGSGQEQVSPRAGMETSMGMDMDMELDASSQARSVPSLAFQPAAMGPSMIPGSGGAESSHVPHLSSYSSLTGWAGGSGAPPAFSGSDRASSVLSPAFDTALGSGRGADAFLLVPASSATGYAFPYSEPGSTVFPGYYQYAYGQGFDAMGQGAGNSVGGGGVISGGDAIAFGPGPNATPTPSPTEGPSNTAQQHANVHPFPLVHEEQQQQLQSPPSFTSTSSQWQFPYGTMQPALDSSRTYHTGRGMFVPEYSTSSGIPSGSARPFGTHSALATASVTASGGEGAYMVERGRLPGAMGGSPCDRAKDKKK